MSVNKKTMMLVTGTAIGAFGLIGCGAGSSSTFKYEVSGTVEAAQVDYECGGDVDLDADPVAFVAGKGKGTGPSARKSSGGSTKSSSKTKDQGSRPSTATKAPTAKAKTPGPAASVPTAPNRGVTLSKKPDKPERVIKVKPPKYKSKPRGCRNEYELFVRNKDGLFEQDVREVDYDRCSDKPRELFPACTSN